MAQPPGESGQSQLPLDAPQAEVAATQTAPPETEPDLPEVPVAPAAPTDARSALERFRDGVRGNRRALMWMVPLSAGAVGLAWVWLNAEAPSPPRTRLGQGSTVESSPVEPTSPAYRQAMEETDEARKDDAAATGDSFVPTFQSQTGAVEPTVAAPVMPSTAAPSVAVREAPQRVEQREAAAPPPVDEDPVLQEVYPEPQARGTELLRREVEEAEAGALGDMFDALLERWNEAPKMTVIRYDVERGQAGSGTGAVAAAPGAEVAGNPDAPAAPGALLVPAGRMLYASTKVGVDSELGLPVLVEVHERPFRGALLTGEFQQVRDRVVVRFSRLTDHRRGLELPVNAYAVGLECECGAVDGVVDRHWFSRVVLPAAFGFAEEYLRAAGEPDRRVIVNGEVVIEESEDEAKDRIARGLAGAVGRTGDVVLESLPRRATVRLPRGTELAVVFVDGVREEVGRQG